jgi:hypothetical protein
MIKAEILKALPKLSAEERREETPGLTDRPEAFQKVLSQRQNRYLTRQLYWIMTIEGLETYILATRDSHSRPRGLGSVGRISTTQSYAAQPSRVRFYPMLPLSSSLATARNAFALAF